MVVFFNAPHSFTGEDACELFLHGSPYIVQRALSALCQKGFRLAEPGEFTRRAFLNGKMDLTSAEGIGALVSSSSRGQWIAASQLFSGRLKDAITSLRGQVIQALALLTAIIDFPDEEDVNGTQLKAVDDVVTRVRSSIVELLGTYENGDIASGGLKVALVGEPNAGKSTLLNYLLKEERSIVTDEAGTTRDFIEAPCMIKGRLVKLYDTAGIRDSDSKIERLGIKKSLEFIEKADVVIYLHPQDRSLETIDSALLQRVQKRRSLLVRTKSDLKSDDNLQRSDWLPISCQSGTGLESLKSRLMEIVDRSIEQLQDTTFITSARHQKALEDAEQELMNYMKQRNVGHSLEELLAADLQRAARHLSSLVGEIGNEDVLDAVFSTFCVGK